MPLPKLTTKQQAILIRIYRHRFLERKQVQAFMGHTDKRRVSAWLKDLRAKHYIEWLYHPDDPRNSSKPAIYYLGLNSIRLLRELGYPTEELRKRYKESSRQQPFVERCLLLVVCCLAMEAKTAESNGTTYTYATETDYANPENTYYFLHESELIHPNLCYVKEKDTGEAVVITTSLLEVFDTSLPRYSVRNRLKDYIEFLDSGEWEEAGRADGLPIILIVCPTKDGLIYAKRYTRKLLADTYGESEDVPEDIRIRFTTTEQLRQFGITGRVWEQV